MNEACTICTLSSSRVILRIVACLVCKHSKRFEIETAIKNGTPKLRIAKTFGVRRASILDHIKLKHEEADPVKPPDVAAQDDEVVDRMPYDIAVRHMTKAERTQHIDRLLSDRQFYGSETIAKLARLWRDMLGKEAERQVAELFAEAFKRRTIAAGSKDLRRKFAIAELLSMYRRCRESGDNKTAAIFFDRYIELDNLKDNPSLDRAVLVQIVQLIRHENPQFAPRVEEHLAQFEIVVDQAKAVLEGENVPHTLTEEASNAGIDTRIPSSDEPSSE